MAQPTTQLNATEQDTLVKQIGLALLRAAPRDWRRVTAEYRAVGRYHEMAGEIITEDGAAQEWVATHDIATLFGRLRAGMYRDGRGTWFNAKYQLDHPSSYNLEYNRDEPEWNLAPPPLAYSDELRMFPRSEENVPEWVIRRMSGLAPEQAGPRFRIARIFDTVGPAGRPVINRPDLEVAEQDRLLEYLNSAPLVVSDRGYDLDRLAQTPEATVPVAFHSDGLWIWPAAVNYYLREYGVSPEPDLVEHVRAAGFTLPDVDHQTLQAAGAYLQPPRPPGPSQAPSSQAPAPPPPVAVPLVVGRPSPEPNDTELGTAEPPAPPFEAEFDQTQFHDPIDFDQPDDDQFDEPGQLVAEAGTGQEADANAAELSAHDTGTNGSERRSAQGPAFTPGPQIDPGSLAAVSLGNPPRAEAPGRTNRDESARAQHTQPPVAPAEPREPALLDLQTKLDELDIAENNYRIGEPTELGWSLEQVETGWRVGWYDGELTNPAVFGDVEDAAAFMLGKLVLAPSGQGQPEQTDEADEKQTQAPEFGTTGHAGGEEPVEVGTPAEPSLRRGLGEATTAMPPSNAQPGQLPRREPPLAAPPISAPLPSQPVPVQPPRSAPPQAPLPPQTPRMPTRRENPVRPAAASSEQRPGSAGQQQWPIYPMAGEPPLTLFRGKELRELPAGSELDRFGGPNGNLTYAAGTPFEERSLVPEWVHRPYHVYRVQRPLEALAGVAIPWFNQPGGGAAYLLPASIDELVATGDLLELDPGEPPID